MSTENDQPTGTAPTAAPPMGTAATAVAPTGIEPTTTEPGDAVQGVEEQQREPGWFDRNSAAVIAVSVALIAVVAALVALFFYRESVEKENTDTEAAVTAFVEEQGGEVETVECDGDTCDAIVSGSAYTVLVQDDEDGKQRFGITAYTGD